MSKLSNKNNEYIDIIKLFSIIWNQKWLIVSLTSIFAIASVAISLLIPNQYKAEVVLISASNSPSNSLSNLAGKFGSLASFAGFDLGSINNNEKSIVAIEVIKSWGFIDEFIRENDISVEVFAAYGWDKYSGDLLINNEIYDEKNNKWVRDFAPEKGETAHPSSWELFEIFVDMVNVEQDKNTGLITVSIEYYSPKIAKEWLELLVDKINRDFQSKDKKIAEKNISFLKSRISQTDVSEMQKILYQLIEEQTKTLMLTEVSGEYVLDKVSIIKQPEKKSKPKRLIIVIFLTLLGFVLSFLVALMAGLMRQESGGEAKLR